MKASARQKTSQPDLLLLLPPVIPTSPFLKQPDKQKPTNRQLGALIVYEWPVMAGTRVAYHFGNYLL